MTRLRPEQVAGALFQCSSLTTLGPQSHWFIRMVTYTGRNDFVRRYGDTGEDEFDARGGTIPQRLVLMNGDIVRDKIKSDLFTAPGRIADLAPDDRKAVETAYLAVLTRRPSPEEESHFMARLAGRRPKSAKRPTDRSLLGLDQHDRILLEPLRPAHDAFSLDSTLDRRGFLKLAGLSWLTPVGQLLADQAERSRAAGAVDHSLVAGRRAQPARNV